MESSPMPSGLYRHYKGNYYQVIGYCRHSETLEDMVIYFALSDHGLWVRPKTMFEEQIMHEGVLQPRFQFVRSLVD